MRDWTILAGIRLSLSETLIGGVNEISGNNPSLSDSAVSGLGFEAVDGS